MSYLALARKWRPKSFADVVGQEHIVRALTNALAAERVHHAYLFSGTRGVGKTTVARILAKALNCDAGVSGEPCGKCSACVSIDEGRFVDLLEVDAASKTKVDDTRELLENVQYTPTTGRFKVYLIDEVHMLSNHSFNALLKTLEEPPPHVKFLLATTDPQKLPVTILSRCLQFNLKRLSTTQIVDRMEMICKKEKIKSDAGALTRIAKAAAGSMRDALSLLDQALAFGDGKLNDADVADMLGSIDPRHIRELLQCLVDGDAVAMMSTVRQLQELVPDYEGVLDDLATVLQQIAVTQLAGADALDEDADHDLISGFAGLIPDDLVQLYYQIAIHGRRDLGLAPDPRVGFEMTLLRMLAFRPGAAAAGGTSQDEGAGRAGGSAAAGGSTAAAAAPAQKRKAVIARDADWSTLIGSLGLTGAVRELAESCHMTERSESALHLELPQSSEYLLTDQLRQALIGALQSSLGANLHVDIRVVQATDKTIADVKSEGADQRQQDAHESIFNDPNVQDLVNKFGATVEEDSIRPLNGSDN